MSEPRVSQLCRSGLDAVARICRARERGLSVEPEAAADAEAFAHLVDAWCGDPPVDDPSASGRATDAPDPATDLSLHERAPGTPNEDSTRPRQF